MKKHRIKAGIGIFICVVIAVAIYFLAGGGQGGDSGQSSGTGANGAAGMPTNTPFWQKPSRADALKTIGQMNEQTTTFYGRVIDQDGNPIAGAMIGGAALFNNMISYGKRDYDAVSDDNGYFVFPNIKGRDFNCTPRKSGYIYFPKKGYNGYVLSQLAPTNERFVSDPKKPEIFRLWKIKGAEELLCGAWRFSVRPDQTLYGVDLKIGRNAKDEGDVAFWCKYTPVSEDAPSEERIIEWEFGIKVAGGGVIETDSTLHFEAPLDGYREDWSLRRVKGGDRPNFGERTFYIKTAEGKYGVFIVKALYDSTNPDCSTRVAWKLNPTGSRNLEPGKEKMLKKGSRVNPGEPLLYILRGGG